MKALEELTPKQIRLRDYMVSRILAFQESQGCKSCKVTKIVWIKDLHSLRFHDLLGKYTELFGYPPPSLP